MNLKTWANGTLCLIIFCLFGYGLDRVSRASDIVDLFKPEVRVSPTAEALAGEVELDGYRFEINQVTHQVKASFAITNEGSASVYDIAISCDLTDRSGADRGTGRWLVYKTVAPGSTEHYRVEDKRYISHLVTPDTIHCRIVDLKTTGTVVAANGAGGH